MLPPFPSRSQHHNTTAQAAPAHTLTPSTTMRTSSTSRRLALFLGLLVFLVCFVAMGSVDAATATPVPVDEDDEDEEGWNQGAVEETGGKPLDLDAIEGMFDKEDLMRQLEEMGLSLDVSRGGGGGGGGRKKETPTHNTPTQNRTWKSPLRSWTRTTKRGSTKRGSTATRRRTRTKRRCTRSCKSSGLQHMGWEFYDASGACAE